MLLNWIFEKGTSILGVEVVAFVFVVVDSIEINRV